MYVADDAPETRSSVRLAELRDWPDEAASPGEVLDRFVAERLITLDADTAQITHEALLTAWPLLRTWIDADREGLRVRRRLSDAARTWDEAGRDPAALLRGGQLALARDWAADPVNRDSLSTLTRAFVDAGIAAGTTAAGRGAQPHQRGCAASSRRSRVLVLLTVGLAGYAFQQRQAATSARDNATTARNTAQSREVAIEADQVARAERRRWPPSSAWPPTGSRRPPRPGPACWSRPAARPRPGCSIRPAWSQAVSLSPDHRVLAVAAADGTLRLWNVARPGHPVALGAAAAAQEPQRTRCTRWRSARTAASSPRRAPGRTVLLWNVREPGSPGPARRRP